MIWSKLKLRKEIINLLLLCPTFAVAIFFVLIPFVSVVFSSFIVTSSNAAKDLGAFTHFIKVLTNPFYLQAIGNSFKISFFSALLGLIIASIVANSMCRVGLKLKQACLLISNMLSNFAGVPLAAAFMILIGTSGAISVLLKLWQIPVPNLFSEWGVFFIYVYFQVPLGILLILPAFDSLKQELREAAYILGCSTWTLWIKVYLPILMPRLLGTFVILFANAMGAYATIYALMLSNYNMVTIRIGSLIAGDVVLNFELASALSIVLVIICILLITLNEIFLKKQKKYCTVT